MINALVILIWFTLVYSTAFAQPSTTKTMVVIDSTLVSMDQDQLIQISQDDISSMSIIKQKDSLRALGFSGLDSVVYIFTKAYEKRSDSVRKIASTKKMEVRNDSCFLNGIPFSGPFIDYFFCGRKQAEGTYNNGRLSGQYKSYYRNGKVAKQIYYSDKTSEELTIGFFPNGSIFYKTQIENGRPKGVSTSYFLNGQLADSAIFGYGSGAYDTIFFYYSSGKVKDKIYFENGKLISTLTQINEFLSLSFKSYRKGDKKKASNYWLKAIGLDSSYSDAYLQRGLIKLEELNWEAALADFDTALKFEPYFLPASVYRAFATIRYYEFLNKKKLSNRKNGNVLSSELVLKLTIEDQEKLCNNLQIADQFIFGLKDVSFNFIAEALLNYCQIKSSR